MFDIILKIGQTISMCMMPFIIVSAIGQLFFPKTEQKEFTKRLGKIGVYLFYAGVAIIIATLIIKFVFQK
jgi:hypothetical protein